MAIATRRRPCRVSTHQFRVGRLNIARVLPEPDSDASDPGPKPNLRKPRADWAVIGKLEFSDDDGDGAQP